MPHQPEIDRQHALRSLHTRPLIESDLAAAAILEHGSCPAPWSAIELGRRLRQANVVSLAAEFGQRGSGQIAGYIIGQQVRRMIRLERLTIAAGRRRCGIGALLVRQLAHKLRPGDCRRLFLEVRESNLIALQFFRSQGFRAIATRQAAFLDTRESGIVMELALDSWLGLEILRRIGAGNCRVLRRE